MSERDDLEVSFVRELAADASIVGSTDSPEGRREAIRIAILRRQLADVTMRGESLTFAQAYQRCYERPLDRRRVQRPALRRARDFGTLEEGNGSTGT